MSVEDKLVTIFKLQQIDSKLNEINILKGELPIEVKDLEDEIAGLVIRMDKMKEGVSEYDSIITDHRNTMKDSETLIEKYNTQIENVKNNREYDALNKELELQKLEIQLCEKKIRDINRDIDNKKSLLDEYDVLLTAKKLELQHKKDELGKIIGDTEKEENSLVKDSAKVEKSIDERLLSAYKRIQGTYKNGLAVVPYDRNSCGGCFAKIPPQRQMEIKQRMKIIVCEHCGRVLVDPELASAN